MMRNFLASIGRLNMRNAFLIVNFLNVAVNATHGHGLCNQLLLFMEVYFGSYSDYQIRGKPYTSAMLTQSHYNFCRSKFFEKFP